ncbi:MAG: cell division protein FtsZ [Saprospiraceae bacterium]|nr:cell division protein FtsZ [Saprospiraceae bacterium]MBK6565449.1 cell division protein FtsZ [Saprospiraceae bacterium]MBK7522717.1 cell division protein FtsZ [Saprospiraceae bacterium]MBK8079970.1 cell division protein FtsZ [Saprospiraceae bacterium]MBK8370894.1 cell division protein FtsZ [Saprospiraceae bacterium]
MMFDIQKNKNSIIKVIGVGGGGGNAVGHMFKQGINGVDFAICNTDEQALECNPVNTKIALGPNLTEGRGAGSLPEVGKQSCIESIEDIRKWLSDGTKMLFITAGMGGGTGTGAAPIIAKVAKEMDILTVGIVTLPFKFEGMRRQRQALEGLEQLKKNVDSILVISNDKLREMHGNLSLTAAFGQADNILTTAAKGIAEIITVPGYINVDFEDVNTVMKNSGVAIMGTGIAEGDDRARKAIHEALNSPLLEDNDIRGAQHILLNITSGSMEVTMDEIGEITDYVQEEAGYGTDLIWGNCNDETLGDKIIITLIATGFEGGNSRKKEINEKAQAASRQEARRVPLEKPFSVVIEEDEFEIEFESQVSSNVFEFDDIPASHTSSNHYSEDKEERKNQGSTTGENGQRILSEELKAKREADSARREFLRKANSKPLDNPKIISDLESVPAYTRRNVILDEENKNNASQKSKYSVNMEDDGTVFISNNSFLYDNVD